MTSRAHHSRYRPCKSRISRRRRQRAGGKCKSYLHFAGLSTKWFTQVETRAARVGKARGYPGHFCLSVGRLIRSLPKSLREWQARASVYTFCLLSCPSVPRDVLECPSTLSGCSAWCFPTTPGSGGDHAPFPSGARTYVRAECESQTSC